MFEPISNYCVMFWFIISTVVFGFVYQLVIRYWFYFADRNVKFIRGVPLLGSAYKSLIGIEPAAISYRRCYELFPKEKFIGIYDVGGRPSYLIRDPVLIKQLLITDFNHFVDHKLSFKNENDLLSRILFGLSGLKWHKMRSTISPAFTNSTLQKMHNLIIKSSEEFIATLKATDKITKIFDSRDLFKRYISDIIATTAFGIEINSMRDVDNDFFKIGCSLSELKPIDCLKFMLVKFLDIRITDDKNTEFLRKILKEKIETRKKQNIVRNDMIDLLIKAQNGQLDYDDSEDNANIGFASTLESNIGKSNDKIESERRHLHFN